MNHSASNETWTLNTSTIGQRVLVYRQTESTNSLALAQSENPQAHGLVFLAHEQTAGRGQYGRTWHSPQGSSVLLSVLLFPPERLRRPALLTAWAAVSVCDTIGKLADLQATIKWPNDVLIAGKKTCGILIEQRTTGSPETPLATVAGIGLNVSQSAEMFEQAGLPLATSLASASGASFTFEDVARELIGTLDEHYQRLLDGDYGTLEEIWKARLGLVGKSVIVEGVHESHRGRLLDVALTGITLEVDGAMLRLAPEAIRHIEHS